MHFTGVGADSRILRSENSEQGVAANKEWSECEEQKLLYLSPQFLYDQFLDAIKPHLNEACWLKKEHSLPFLEKEELIEIVKLLTTPITVKKKEIPDQKEKEFSGDESSFTLTFPLYELLVYLKRTSNPFLTIQKMYVVGGVVYKILNLYVRRLIATLGITDPELLKALDHLPSDTDLRLCVPYVKEWNDFDQLNQQVINFLTYKLHQQRKKGAFNDLKKEICEFGLLNKFIRFEKGDYFSVISLGGKDCLPLDLLFVQNLLRKSLFVQDSIRLEISQLFDALEKYRWNGEHLIKAINEGKYFQRIVPESDFGLQPFIDRLANIVRAINPETINEKGIILLLSSYVKGKRCLQPELEKVLWASFDQILKAQGEQNFSYLLGGEKKHAIRKWRIHKLTEWTKKTIKDHHQNDPVAALCLTLSICSSLEKVHPKWISEIWKEMTPSFAASNHSLLPIFARFMEKNDFASISCFLQAKSFLHLFSSEQREFSSVLIMHNGGIAIQATLEQGCSVLFPFDPVHALQSEELKELNLVPCGTLSLPEFPVDFPWEYIQKLGEKFLEDANENVRRLGVELMLVSVIHTKNSNLYHKLIDLAPEFLHDTRFVELLEKGAITERHAQLFDSYRRLTGKVLQDNWMYALAQSEEEEWMFKAYQMWLLHKSPEEGLVLAKELGALRPDLSFKILRELKKGRGNDKLDLQSGVLAVYEKRKCRKIFSHVQTVEFLKGLERFLSQPSEVLATQEVLAVVSELFDQFLNDKDVENACKALRLIAKHNFDASVHTCIPGIWEEKGKQLLSHHTEPAVLEIWKEMLVQGRELSQGALLKLCEAEVENSDLPLLEEKWSGEFESSIAKQFASKLESLRNGNELDSLALYLQKILKLQELREATLMNQVFLAVAALMQGEEKQLEQGYAYLCNENFYKWFSSEKLQSLRLIFLEKALVYYPAKYSAEIEAETVQLRSSIAYASKLATHLCEKLKKDLAVLSALRVQGDGKAEEFSMQQQVVQYQSHLNVLTTFKDLNLTALNHQLETVISLSLQKFITSRLTFAAVLLEEGKIDQADALLSEVIEKTKEQPKQWNEQLIPCLYLLEAACRKNKNFIRAFQLLEIIRGRSLDEEKKCLQRMLELLLDENWKETAVRLAHLVSLFSEMGKYLSTTPYEAQILQLTANALAEYSKDRGVLTHVFFLLKSITGEQEELLNQILVLIKKHNFCAEAWDLFIQKKSLCPNSWAKAIESASAYAPGKLCGLDFDFLLSLFEDKSLFKECHRVIAAVLLKTASYLKENSGELVVHAQWLYEGRNKTEEALKTCPEKNLNAVDYAVATALAGSKSPVHARVAAKRLSIYLNQATLGRETAELQHAVVKILKTLEKGEQEEELASLLECICQRHLSSFTVTEFIPFLIAHPSQRVFKTACVFVKSQTKIDRELFHKVEVIIKRLAHDKEDKELCSLIEWIRSKPLQFINIKEITNTLLLYPTITSVKEVLLLMHQYLSQQRKIDLKVIQAFHAYLMQMCTLFPFELDKEKIDCIAHPNFVCAIHELSPVLFINLANCFFNYRGISPSIEYKRLCLCITAILGHIPLLSLDEITVYSAAAFLAFGKLLSLNSQDFFLNFDHFLHHLAARYYVTESPSTTQSKKKRGMKSKPVCPYPSPMLSFVSKFYVYENSKETEKLARVNAYIIQMRRSFLNFLLSNGDKRLTGVHFFRYILNLYNSDFTAKDYQINKKQKSYFRPLDEFFHFIGTSEYKLKKSEIQKTDDEIPCPYSFPTLAFPIKIDDLDQEEADLLTQVEECVQSVRASFLNYVFMNVKFTNLNETELVSSLCMHHFGILSKSMNNKFKEMLETEKVIGNEFDQFKVMLDSLVLMPLPRSTDSLTLRVHQCNVTQLISDAIKSGIIGENDERILQYSWVFPGLNNREIVTPIDKCEAFKNLISKLMDFDNEPYFLKALELITTDKPIFIYDHPEILGICYAMLLDKALNIHKRFNDPHFLELVINSITESDPSNLFIVETDNFAQRDVAAEVCGYAFDALYGLIVEHPSAESSEKERLSNTSVERLYKFLARAFFQNCFIGNYHVYLNLVKTLLFKYLENVKEEDFLPLALGICRLFFVENKIATFSPSDLKLREAVLLDLMEKLSENESLNAKELIKFILSKNNLLSFKK